MPLIIRRETQTQSRIWGGLGMRAAALGWICAVVFLSSQPAHAAVVRDLSLTLKATPNPVAVNSKLTYSLEVKNLGNRPVTDIILTDHLPENVDFKSAPPDCKFANQHDENKNIITCEANRLLPNTSVIWSLLVKTPPEEGKLKNRASVAFNGTDNQPDNNTASVITTVRAGNRPPVASAISLRADAAIPYVEQQLIGTDPDKDTVSYILDAPESGPGYTLAYLNPTSGMLYVTLAAGFRGTITLPYRVSDGKLYSAPANVKIVVRLAQQDKGLGGLTIDPGLYASFQEAGLSGDLFGAPGQPPSEPPSVDLSPNFPAPGDQGRQSSCTAWASAYALKSYQEGVEMKWPLSTTAHLFSPAYVYNQINQGQDAGAQIYNALDVIIQQGAATLATVPYSDTDYLTQPSAAAKKEAARFKAVSRSIVNGTQAIKAALANRKPVVIGMLVYDQFYNLHGEDSVYNSAQGSTSGPHGRHAITVVGYDNIKYGGAFKVINSWGGNWGDHGYFWLPYSFAEQVVFQAWVLDDGKNKQVPDNPDNVVPPVDGKLPNLQVQSWSATYNATLGGSGAMEWSVVNSGTAPAPAGATVALVLSKDKVINANDTYVVYDQIPFPLQVGGRAYRSFAEGNSIAFKIPGTITPGDYYLALWVDDLNRIKESKENDNISLDSQAHNFSDTLPDLDIQSWYAQPYDFFGTYALTYQIMNSGTRRAPKNFSVSLVLSTTDNLGDGNQRWLFFERYPFSLPPNFQGGRDVNSAALFDLYQDINNHSIPAGYYYMAFWLDYENNVAESDKTNNTSFSWGLVSTYRSASGRSQSPVAPDMPVTTDEQSVAISTIPPASPIFNGKQLPQANVQLRKVKISETPSGRRALEFVETPPHAPTRQALPERVFNKTATADDIVIFPTQDSTPMPVSQ